MVIILGTIEGAVSAARILALSGLNFSLVKQYFH